MSTYTPAPLTRWIVGVDLGQSIDPTAIAVIEATDIYEPQEEGALKRAPTRTAMDVRHLERLPLQMSYTAQVTYVGNLLRRPPLVDPKLVIDMTGCGRPVFDMFSDARLRPEGVTITAGDVETRGKGQTWRVAKLLLVSRLQAALHAGDLRVAKEQPEAQTLVRELQAFRATLSETGRPRFGAREGAHDDLVLAVAIACWYAERANRRVPTVGHCSF